MGSTEQAQRWALAALAAIVLSVTGAGIHDDFVWQDHQLPAAQAVAVRENPEDRRFTAAAATNRPLTQLTFVLDKQLWGASAYGPHAVNVLLHTANTVLILQVAAAAVPGASLGAAFSAALLFGVHPAIAEGYYHISSRSVLLGLLFALLAVASLLRGGAGTTPLGPRALLVATALLGAGALAHESVALAFPGLALWLGLRAQAPSREPDVASARWMPAVVFLMGLVLFLLARAAMLGSLTNVPLRLDGWSVLPRSGYLLLLGIGDWVLPTSSTPRHLWEIFVSLSLLNSIAGVGALAVVALLLWRFRRQQFAIAAVGVAVLIYAPTVLVTYVEGWYGFSRYLYIPFGFLALALVPAIDAADSFRLPLKEQALPAWMFNGALLGLVTSFAVMTIGAASDWRSNLSLWSAVEKAYPQASHGLQHRAVNYMHDGRYVEAEVLLHEAIRRSPENRTAWIQLLTSLTYRLDTPACLEVAADARTKFPLTAVFPLLEATCAQSLDVGRSVAAVLVAIKLEPDTDVGYELAERMLQRQPRVVAPLIREALATAAYADLAPRLDSLLEQVESAADIQETPPEAIPHAGD